MKLRPNVNKIVEENILLKIELNTLKDKYELLCSQIKQNANKERNNA
jgi:regulator of replication initiation timing